MTVHDLILQDQLTEIRTILDAEWGDPSEWGPEWDEDRWELGPDHPPGPDLPYPEPDEEPTYEPDLDDREWSAAHLG